MKAVALLLAAIASNSFGRAGRWAGRRRAGPSHILLVTLAQMRAGASLSQAYYRALLFTGKVVMLTGVTLAIGVVTWIASPIKSQADMGVLLAFMFLWNMIGALVLLPALAHFLLKPTCDADAEVVRDGAAVTAV
jgi:hypothetical protein